MGKIKMNFKEWLAQQGTDERREADRQRAVEHWTDLAAELFAQMIRWLALDDMQKLLKVSSSKVVREEQGLGRYEAPTLSIHLRDQVVDLIPVARNVVGAIGARGDLGFRAEGRIDMANGPDKFMLYHAVYPTEKRWVMVDDDTYTVRPLDKDNFEAALQDLFS